MRLWKWASERDLIVSAVDLWGLGVGVFFRCLEVCRYVVVWRDVS